MQLSNAALILAVVLLISRSAQAESAYDAVDALLSPGPSVAVGEPLAPPVSLDNDAGDSLIQSTAGLTAPEGGSYSNATSLSTTIDPTSTELPLDSAAVSTSEQHSKSKPLSRTDIVPEPSALAMGTVALIFFLLFGRRRRLS